MVVIEDGNGRKLIFISFNNMVIVWFCMAFESFIPRLLKGVFSSFDLRGNNRYIFSLLIIPHVPEGIVKITIT